MHGLNEAAVVELEELRASAGGFLKPADIVERAYTSLASDRTTHEGYRATVDVLDDEAATAAAMRELQRAVTALRAKYGAWAALRPALDQMLAAVENVGAM